MCPCAITPTPDRPRRRERSGMLPARRLRPKPRALEASRGRRSGGHESRDASLLQQPCDCCQLLARTSKLSQPRGSKRALSPACSSTVVVSEPTIAGPLSP